MANVTFTLALTAVNGNSSTAVTLHLSVDNDSSASKTVAFSASERDKAITVETTEYKSNLRGYFSASGYENSESSSVPFEYNPLDYCSIATNTGRDERDENIWTIYLINNSNFNLSLPPYHIFSGTIFGEAYNSTGSDIDKYLGTKIEVGKREVIYEKSQNDNMASRNYDFGLEVNWTLNGMTIRSQRNMVG